MKTFLADSSTAGTVFCHEFEAEDRFMAEKIAARMGWNLLGTLEEVEECPADTIAMIEKMVTNPTLH